MGDETRPDRTRNRWLLRARGWHAWAGVVAVPVLALLAVTGVYLNHPDLFRLDPAPPPTDPGLLTTATAAEVPVGPGQALAAARAEWEDVPVAFVQLRPEGDRLVWKVRRRGRGDEVTVDAGTGRVLAVRTGAAETRYGLDGAAVARVSWSRLMFDLHTGRIGGDGGRLAADAGGVVLLGLIATGVYLFAVPRIRRRQAARGRPSQAPRI